MLNGFGFNFLYSQTIAETEKNIMKEQLAKCLKAEGVSDGQLDGYFAGRDLQNDNAKCLASCAMEQFTVVCNTWRTTIDNFFHSDFTIFDRLKNRTTERTW